MSQSSELHFTFYTLCLCTMYTLFVFALSIYVDIIFLILLVAFDIVSMHVYVCAHCVYSFCSKLYKIFVVFILSFGCYLCVEVCHQRFEILHLLTKK
jgi:hypothetical protein